MPADIVVYHHPCADGFTSAWVAQLYMPEARLLPATYNDKFKAPLLQQVTPDTNVWFVDFSADRAFMLDLCALAKSVTVIDHHKTAQATLTSADAWPANFKCVFDMERSGAQLCWDFFFPAEPTPPLIQYVMDRDLWKFQLADSKAVSEYIAVVPTTISAWNLLDADLRFRFSYVVSAGQALLKGLDRQIERVLPHVVFRTVGGHVIPTVNSAHAVSEIGHAMCRAFPASPFALIWSVDSDDHAVCSLRVDGDFDASVIAKAYGGGGHRAACGFRLPLTHFVEKFRATPAP